MAEAGERAEWVKRPAAAIEGTNCTLGDYQSLYARSVEDTDAFWAGQAKRLDWFAQPTKIANSQTSRFSQQSILILVNS